MTKQILFDEPHESIEEVEVEVSMTFTTKITVKVPTDEFGYKSYSDVKYAVNRKLGQPPHRKGWQLKNKKLKYT